MMNKDIFNKEFLRVVAADLDYIIKEWDPEIDDDSLRRDCVVLRRLLVEDNLGQAWRAVGFEKQPKILTPSLKTIGDRKSADFTQAGRLQSMAWNTENEDGSMVRVVNQPHKTALRVVGFEDKDISKTMYFPATRRELLDKLQAQVVMFHDKIEVKALFPVEPIYRQLCTSPC